jgi:streptogrisin C
MGNRTRAGIAVTGALALGSAGYLGLAPSTAAENAPPQVVRTDPGPDRIATLASSIERRLGAKAIGSYVDPATGRVVVSVSDQLSAALVRASGAVPKLSRFTAAELGTVKSRLDRLAASSDPGKVRAWSVDPISNTVVVKVGRGRADAATERFLRQVRANGAKVTVRKSAGTVRPAADLLGGHQVNMSNGYLCSAGFNARTSSGARIFLTAGHCTVDRPTFSRAGITIGSTRLSRYPGNDYGAVNISSSAWVQRGLVEGWSVADIRVRGTSSAPVGARLCKSGRTTGWTCGSVTAKNVTVNYGGGDVVSGLYEHSACVEGGDSGGPNLSGNYAQGLTSGASMINGLCLQKYGQPNESYSQPIGEALSASSASLVLG